LPVPSQQTTTFFIWLFPCRRARTMSRRKQYSADSAAPLCAGIHTVAQAKSLTTREEAMAAFKVAWTP